MFLIDSMDRLLGQEKPIPFDVVVGDIYETKVCFSSGEDSLEIGSHFFVREIFDDGSVGLNVMENGVNFTLNESEIETLFTDGSLEIEEDIDIEDYRNQSDL